MKKIIFLLALSFFLTGCPDGDLQVRYYTLENTSNHSLELKFYREGLFLNYLTTTLPEKGDKYRETIDYYSNESNLFLFKAFDADSIVVNFDGIKRRTYAIDFINESFLEPINRNIFRHENYEHIGNDRFLFSITEEDYNSAEDID